ncbi:tetratricopeptide repeat protein [Candidatus Tisiphia endosymbiont of Beris chalybata]|uniref:tetratricopeptide repeat protein n=1 Tax=Candidatus Tisiphia endosymbiont of Beris chalybata TaxID=3066262 RepID=UPI00312C9644
MTSYLYNFVSIINSGEFGARSDGATPIYNRQALSDDVTNFSSVDYIIWFLRMARGRLFIYYTELGLPHAFKLNSWKYSIILHFLYKSHNPLEFVEETNHATRAYIEAPVKQRRVSAIKLPFRLTYAGSLLLILLLSMHSSSFGKEKITNLIVPVSYFVNHQKQLKEAREYLNKYRQVSIIGTSGIGKTQFARAYAYEHKDNYNIIWFFDCNLNLNEEFVKLAKQLNQILKANIVEEARDAKKGVLEYLAHKGKWLLIFDNLKIGENKKVKDIIEWEHNGDIMFCSQESGHLPNANALEMSLFDRENTITLAKNLLDSYDDKDIEFLITAFSGYPILIVQAAQLLNKIKGLDKEEYKRKIYQSADKIELNINMAIKELQPSAVSLLGKIALMNNQSFSKQILSIITDNPDTLDDDIYKLSKFLLINNIDSNEEHPIFEMHDIIADKVQKINGNRNNRNYLEDIIGKLVQYIPKSVIKAHIFRISRTIQGNFEILSNNAAKYDINVYKLVGLNLQLIVQYVNSLDLDNTQKLVEWFNKNEKEKKFKLWLMNNDEKALYATYLGLIGVYYKRCANDTVAIEYYTRAQKVFDSVKGYEAFKCNVVYCLVLANIALGRLPEAEQNIQIMDKMFKGVLAENADIITLYFAKARLFFMQGKYEDALHQVGKTINTLINNGAGAHDLFLTNYYMLRAEILNFLGKHHAAHSQAKQLYDMNKPVKPEGHEIYARIYTQFAKSDMEQGKVDKALVHINKAIEILLADYRRNPKDIEQSEDPDLAASYVVQGEIFSMKNNLKTAIESYKKANVIYFYLYRNNSKNVAQVSYLYLQGAKAACKAKDLYNYKFFGKPQIKEFGLRHPNSTAMLEYCTQHNMNLWSKN